MKVPLVKVSDELSVVLISRVDWMLFKWRFASSTVENADARTNSKSLESVTIAFSMWTWLDLSSVNVTLEFEISTFLKSKIESADERNRVPS